MKENTQPLLSIGMIFKNEIRCLERCLKSLLPLQEAIPCEVIMADTGSTDGSREVASHYADILFDFPWINDFAAARNAVMERASGKWYLTIDADEYLDKDIAELVNFLKSSSKNHELLCAVVQRNYETLEEDTKYSDFLAVRLVCMSTKLRYQGAIHEAWPFEEKGLSDVRGLLHTILHHDGYASVDSEQAKEKKQRNLSLLRKRLEKHPEDLRTLLQYIESGRKEKDHLDILQCAMTITETKKSGWEQYGPPVFRYAVRTALEEELPEFWEWVERSKELFPDSFFTRIDVEYIAFSQALKEGNHISAIHCGERYLQSIEEFNKQESSLSEIVYSVLLMSSPYWEQSLKIYLADIYIKKGRPKRAWELLQDIDGTVLDAQLTGNLLCVLGDLHRLSRLDTSPMLLRFYQTLGKPVPSEKRAEERKKIFYQTALLAFLSQTREDERQMPNFCRPSYMLFLPLMNECDIGRGAVVLSLQKPDEIQLVLSNVEDWGKFPIEAFAHALESGVSFPLPKTALKAEEMERLAARLSESIEDYGCWLMDMLGNIKKESPQNLQTLVWTQRLIMAAVRSFGWKSDKTGKGVELARFFAQSEKEYLTRVYNPELLRPESLNLLPALHRFGWYCAKAFDSLNSEDVSAYVRELKHGLDACPEASTIAKYLMEQTPQLAPCSQDISEELLNLADQVRKLLSAYPPNHPAVAAIKKSDAYRKVAELIENDGFLRGNGPRTKPC